MRVNLIARLAGGMVLPVLALTLAAEPFPYNGAQPTKTAVDPANTQRIYAFAPGEGVRVSEDGGVNWADASLGDSAITAFAASGAMLLLGTAEGEIVDSTGRSYSSPRAGHISDLLVQGTGLTVSYGEFRTEGTSLIYRTADMRNIYWEAIDGELPDSPVQGLAVEDGRLTALLPEGKFATRQELVDWEEVPGDWSVTAAGPALETASKGMEREAGPQCKPLIRVVGRSDDPLRVSAGAGTYRLLVTFPNAAGLACSWNLKLSRGDDGWVLYSPRGGVGATAPSRPIVVQVRANPNRAHRTASLTADPNLHQYATANDTLTIIQNGKR